MNVFFERLMIFVAIIGPFANLPQIIKIWVKKKSNGVSLFSWILFSTLSLIWLSYGIFKKDKYVIITFAITLILQLTIVVGTFIYG